ncbi:MAG: 30S ribosomal protein S4 [Candidatus Aenigmarchaeota archaeon]|nr:30S ribosomal protein S4 [Candidatus Aenigmarchaeota archaeon]NIP40330.1 30S ribosomal protein S4 [Candidatus Aenigmarchaeota archaeon]NIQ17824.1 30S ribosomal protein S4 [Candidatus Aenigmarchaeota archaeon]NIS73205.1 30S ribosomal protein S4 [Candidatus Aenigmarchaeota archaeon]
MRKLRRKYKKPKRPWDSSRIEEERKILREFGLRKKREIWMAEAIVREFRRRARDLIAIRDENETKILLDRLVGLGILERGQGLENVLALNVKDILNRRLQTIVLRKNFADTIKQARQKITHGHVYLGNRRIIFPSYIVPVEKERMINLKGGKKG